MVDWPVDRWRALHTGLVTRSTERSIVNPNSRIFDHWWSTGRSTDRIIFFWLFPSNYISGLSFLGHFPTDIFSFLYLFSSPIYSGTVEKSYNNFRTPYNKFVWSKSFFSKDFHIEPKSPHLCFCLSFLSHLYKFFSLHNFKELHLLQLDYRIVFVSFGDQEEGHHFLVFVKL